MLDFNYYWNQIYSYYDTWMAEREASTLVPYTRDPHSNPRAVSQSLDRLLERLPTSRCMDHTDLIVTRLQTLGKNLTSHSNSKSQMRSSIRSQDSGDLESQVHDCLARIESIVTDRQTIEYAFHFRNPDEGGEVSKTLAKSTTAFLQQQGISLEKKSDKTAYCLGSGGYASVYLASVDHKRCRIPDMPDVCAIKFLDAESPKGVLARKFFANYGEGSALQFASMDQPYFTKIYGILVKTDSGKIVMINGKDKKQLQEAHDKNYHILATLMEYLPHSKPLSEVDQHLSYEDRKKLSKKLLQAVFLLHKKGFMHRDIKRDNILVQTDPKTGNLFGFKLIDFGLVIPSENEHHQELEYKGRAGTAGYKSYEMEIDKKYTKNTDLWSIGITLFKIFTRKSPFPDLISNESNMKKALKTYKKFYESTKGLTPISRFQTIFGRHSNLLNPFYRQVSHNSHFCDLMLKLLDPNPETRITAEEAAKHPFFSTNITRFGSYLSAGTYFR